MIYKVEVEIESRELEAIYDKSSQELAEYVAYDIMERYGNEEYFDPEIEVEGMVEEDPEESEPADAIPVDALEVRKVGGEALMDWECSKCKQKNTHELCGPYPPSKSYPIYRECDGCGESHVIKLN